MYNIIFISGMHYRDLTFLSLTIWSPNSSNHLSLCKLTRVLLTLFPFSVSTHPPPLSFYPSLLFFFSREAWLMRPTGLCIWNSLFLGSTWLRCWPLLSWELPSTSSSQGLLVRRGGGWEWDRPHSPCVSVFLQPCAVPPRGLGVWKGGEVHWRELFSTVWDKNRTKIHLLQEGP